MKATPISFRSEFVDQILDGSKCQTCRLRPREKIDEALRRFRKHEWLRLVTGLRTPAYRVLAYARAETIAQVELASDRGVIGALQYLSDYGLQCFAVVEGFVNWAEFWTALCEINHHNICDPAYGVVIRWDPASLLTPEQWEEQS